MKPIYVALLSALIIVTSVRVVCAKTPESSQGYNETQVQGVSSEVVDILWARTDFWWHQGEWGRVVAEDRFITEIDPQFLLPYSTGGWLLESEGQLTEAKEYYILGAKRNPNKSFLWFSLGFYYFNTMKDYPSAIKYFQCAADAPDGGINSWKMLAHSYEKNRQLPQAIAVWIKLQQRYPNDPIVIHNLAKDQTLVLASAPTPGS
jgi:tetratricopeptide (TPR) repeat protein